MIKCVAAFVIGLTLIGCQKQENKKITTLTEPIKTEALEEKPLELESFTFPSEIEGCGCYFAKNNDDLAAEKYIFVDEIDGKTYFKIGDQELHLKKSDDNISMETLTKSIEDKNYKITLNGNRVKNDDEALIFKGNMKVLNKKTGQEIQSPIIGECGC